MPDDVKAWLLDILNAIGEIDGFLPGSKQFADFAGDLRTRRAVERNLEIIGEALGRVLRYDANVAVSNARKIVAARNRIIHGYDTVSVEVVWGIVVRHLPVLRAEVTALLAR